jgi:hypothetical protein
MDFKDIINKLGGQDFAEMESVELATILLRIVERRAGTFCDEDDQWFPIISKLAEIAGLEMSFVRDNWHNYVI